jgi:hypothetical protein
MTAEQLKLRTSIKETLKRFVLIRGTVLGIIGCILLYAALFLPVDQLKIWGFPIILLAGGLIAVGFIPYRTLTKREHKPDELIIEGDYALHFNAQGEPTFTIPLSNVERYSYLEKGNLYGIGLWLKEPNGKVEVHNEQFDLDKFQQNSQKKYECDLFLPYFTQRSYNILNAFHQEE